MLGFMLVDDASHDIKHIHIYILYVNGQYGI